MFLHGLNDTQKKLFLSLAKMAIEIDGKETPEEIELLHDYYLEMELPKETAIQEVEYDVLVKEIKDAYDYLGRKKIYFEIVAIEMIDNEFADVEKEFVLKLGHDFEMSEDEMNTACNIVDSLYKTYYFINEYLYK